MRARERWQLLVLAGLVVALVFVLTRDGGTPAGSSAAPSNTREPGAGAGGPGAETDVKLELLHADREPPSGAARNPFRFDTGADAPAPVFTPPDDNDAFVPVAPPVPSGPPPPPPIPLRYIGYAGDPGGMLTAFFSDGRGNELLGREGDILEGRYKLLRVGTDSVELAYLDGRGRQTIRLSGQ